MTEAADGFELVRVTRDSVGVLRSVAGDVFDDELLPELVDAFLLAHGHLLVVAVSGGAVIGQVQGTVQLHVDGPPQLYVDNLGVAVELRRRGVGTALLAAIGDWGAEHGCEQTWIVTEPDNGAANALYRSIGAEASSVILHSYPTRRSTPIDDR